jgi:hypothetical protein
MSGTGHRMARSLAREELDQPAPHPALPEHEGQLSSGLLT